MTMIIGGIDPFGDGLIGIAVDLPELQPPRIIIRIAMQQVDDG